MTNTPPRVFITGGTGFVGRAIISRLQAVHPDWLLFSYDKEPPNTSSTKAHNPPINHSEVTYLTGDILGLAGTESAISQSSPNVVIHTAGIVPPLSDRYSRRLQSLVYDTNIKGTETVLTASRSTPSVRAFIYTSSCCAVIDDTRFQYPHVNETWRTTSATGQSTIYGESKARAEWLVLAANDPKTSPSASTAASDANGNSERKRNTAFLTTSLRPSVLFGPEDYQLIPSIHACIAKGETPFIIGTGLNYWDVTDVRNVAHAHVLAVENLLSSSPTAAGEAIFFANGGPIPFRDFCREIWKHFGVVPKWEVRVPEGLAGVVAGIWGGIGNLLGLQTTLSAGSVADACAMRYCDERKAERILGYEPVVGLEEGIRESCEWYMRRLEEEGRGKGRGKVVEDKAARGEKVGI